ncbi:hypothetical protein O1611_g910 [Lasiodiplodia mahajangana]|uniref:Uncharacterized protein n=1 Tax=Lasiodiplodia mahajangana TaxID=1108764 RepID=A0ACC2JZT1_9PEZI|nr:hypothetical protein O1611_g910 [Lasiodiplodia mahajangana]
MAPSILIAGATGNTGRGVVETLSKLVVEADSVISGHRIIALTRSSNGDVAQKLAKLPGVEVIEKNWIELTPDWLRENEVVRAFVASQPHPSQFTEESTFLIAALNAGVEYLVRISTTAPNVRPDSNAFYPRTHWALETLLSTPEFERLQWTSLQPNSFSQLYLMSSAELISNYRKTGKQDTLRILGRADAPIGIIDPFEVGILAAVLLAQKDPSPHNKAKYVINGPEDVTGNQVVKLVEQYIGTKVENVVFNDMSFVEAWAAASPFPKNIMLSIKYSLEPMANGLCTAATTSRQVLELAAPKRTPADVLRDMLEG